MFAIADEADVLTGLRLSGVEGRLVSDRREAEAGVEAAQADPQIAVLLITESCAELIPETVKRLKLSSSNPLLVVIPGTKGSGRGDNSITELIREAIGIRI